MALHSLHNFSEVTKAFLTQYVSRQDTKRNSHHLLSVKRRQRDSLKSYINLFQSQLIKVSSYGEEVFALAFISGLHVANPLYKHLLKHNIAKMSKVLYETQPYIQLEEAMKAFSNHSVKPGIGGGSRSLHTKLPTMLKTNTEGNLLLKGKCS